MPRLTLCLIARDEEAMLPGCLASVRGVVDEIVVVDTGSLDATRETARQAGALVVERPWNDDFSAPRNEAARHATGDFVLQLDADERLAPGAGAALRRALASDPPDCCTLRLHNASRLDARPEEVVTGLARQGPPVRLPRLLRRTPDLAWQGIVHESVSAWLAARAARVADLDADIVHLGHVPEVREARGKQARNLGLLRRRCALEPRSVTPIGDLALELVGLGERREAAELVERGWVLIDEQPSDRSILRLAVARGLVALRELDPARVLEAVARGAARDGSHPDLHHLKARALELLALRTTGPDRAALLAGAAESYQRALVFERADAVRQFVAGASSWASWAGLGTVRIQQGDPRAALEAAGRAGATAPLDRDVRLLEAEALLDAGAPERSLALLEPLLDVAPDGWLLAAAAALALGAREDAATFLGRARERARPGYRAPHRRERHAALEAALPAGIARSPEALR